MRSGRKILEAFQPEYLRAAGIGIALEVETESSLHENVNSKIYVKEKNFMAKGFFLWLLGIPFGLIVVLWLFGFLT